VASNSISGKIVHKQTGRGISDILVVLYDMDPGTRAEESVDPPPGGPALSILAPSVQLAGDRIGSVLTGADGSFRLEYDDSEFRIRNQNEQRPDLILLVMAPEEAGPNPDSDTLFSSTPIRQNAGRTEQYLIRLTTEQLKKAGIPLPTTPGSAVEAPHLVIDRMVDDDARTATLIEGARAVNQKRVERARQTMTAFHNDLKPRIRRSLSRVPDNLLNSPSFVAPGESVTDKANAQIRNGIKQVVNSDDPAVRPPIRSYVALTAAQRAAVHAALDPDGSISADALQEILGQGAGPGGQSPGGSTGTTFLVREDPLARFRRERSKSEQESAAALGLGAPAAPDPAGPDTPDDPPLDALPITNGDILRYAGRLMESITAPEEQLLTGLEPHATRKTVDDEIQSLSFGPGPADVPAFYDFHNLQIAFEHVWQEVLDEGLLDLSEDAYNQIVELGGDPGQAPSSIVDPIHRLREESRTVMRAHQVVRDHRSGHSSSGIVRDHRSGHSSSGNFLDTVLDIIGDAIDTGLDPTGFGGHDRLQPGASGGLLGGGTADTLDPLDRLPVVLAELERRLKEAYPFTIYAANAKERSINFGILVTYRQKWTPLGYQAGRLVKTLTLAPRETRKYSKKTVTHRKRADKEVENHLRSHREETNQTSRSEQEIVRKATASTNFTLTASGSIKIPKVTDESTTTTFTQDATKSSDDTKKAFHEAVLKAAQEFKDESTSEVNTETSEDIEDVESGEIHNYNEQLALACLFYELQRRFRVTEQIHQIMPVILVAQEVPRPDEIDEAWILANDWILRRVLLDDSFLPALDYLCQNVTGDEVALRELRANVLQQRRVVDELRSELGVVRDREATYRSLFERSLLHKAGGGGGGLLSAIPVVGKLADEVVNTVEEVAGDVGNFLFSGAASGQTGQDALKDAMDRIADDERNLMFRLEREVTALNDITESYVKALAVHFNHKTQIDRLRIHLKRNILYYMQAIWAHEPPDQRFFRLHKTRVPVMKAVSKRFFPQVNPPVVLARVAERRLGLHGVEPLGLDDFKVETKLDPNLTFTTLAEVADLDNFLGFKGNYMMFPLKQSNPLTDYMMHPYVVAGLNELVDPDDLGNWTLEDFSQYVLGLKQQLSADQFDAIKADLLAQYQLILTNPRPNGDVITVPTDSLFIELLPSSHSLIEKYKEAHRLLDVKLVQSQVRQSEMGNVLRAARILEDKLEDPHVDKKIVVEGGPVPVLDS
jgi:hypothetical protein